MHVALEVKFWAWFVGKMCLAFHYVHASSRAVSLTESGRIDREIMSVPCMEMQ